MRISGFDLVVFSVLFLMMGFVLGLTVGLSSLI